MVLVDLNAKALEKLQQELIADHTIVVVADIICGEDRHRIINETLIAFQGIDILINLAGINPFGSFVQQDAAVIQKTFEINTIAPIMLAHDVLPIMQNQKSGHIVNVGSTFGSIAFAWFTAYSASKFALRGFSQALRRELVDTDIDVTYVAPRAVKTKLNSKAVYDMAKVVKMNMDEPIDVAKKIIKAIKQRKKESYLGFPESLFVRINAMLPGFVDNSLEKQNRLSRQYALREQSVIKSD